MTVTGEQPRKKGRRPPRDRALRPIDAAIAEGVKIAGKVLTGLNRTVSREANRRRAGRASARAASTP